MSGAAILTDKFNNGQEIQFEVPLRRICRIANCKQMFPAGKKFFITLYKAPESFLLTCQDPAHHNHMGMPWGIVFYSVVIWGNGTYQYLGAFINISKLVLNFLDRCLTMSLSFSDAFLLLVS